MDDSGYFSVQVMSEALKVWALELVPLSSERAAPERDTPTYVRTDMTLCNNSDE